MAKKPNASYADLKRQRDELNAQMEQLAQESREDFRTRVLQEAAELEIGDLAAFFAPPKKQKTGRGVSTLPPKYLGPNGETYSGKGRQAGWLAALVAEGKEADDYLNPAYVKAKAA